MGVGREEEGKGWKGGGVDEVYLHIWLKLARFILMFRLYLHSSPYEKCTTNEWIILFISLYLPTLNLLFLFLHYFYFCISFFPISLSLSPNLFTYLPVTISLSLNLYLPDYISHNSSSICLSISKSLFHCLHISISIGLSPISYSICLSIFQSLSLCLHLSLSLSISLSPSLGLSISQIPIFLSPSLSVYLSICLVIISVMFPFISPLV